MFWPLENPETIANNFDIFFGSYVRGGLLTYMEMEMYLFIFLTTLEFTAGKPAEIK